MNYRDCTFYQECPNLFYLYTFEFFFFSFETRNSRFFQSFYNLHICYIIFLFFYFFKGSAWIIVIVHFIKGVLVFFLLYFEFLLYFRIYRLKLEIFVIFWFFNPHICYIIFLFFYFFRGNELSWVYILSRIF